MATNPLLARSMRFICTSCSRDKYYRRNNYNISTPLRYKITSRDVLMLERLQRKGRHRDPRYNLKSFESMQQLSKVAPENTSSLSTSKPKSGWLHPRAQQLSAIFMEYISDLLASGEVNETLARLNFEVAKVTISHGFHTLHVHWVASGGKKDALIEKELPSAALTLRSLLIKLQLMGHTPAVQFVKERESSEMVEIDRRLREADMGDDHVYHYLIHDKQRRLPGGSAPTLSPHKGDSPRRNTGEDPMQQPPETLAGSPTARRAVLDDNSIYGVAHGPLMEKLARQKSLAKRGSEMHLREVPVEEVPQAWAHTDEEREGERNVERRDTLMKYLKQQKLERLRKKGVKKTKTTDDDSYDDDDFIDDHHPYGQFGGEREEVEDEWR